MAITLKGLRVNTKCQFNLVSVQYNTVVWILSPAVKREEEVGLTGNDHGNYNLISVCMFSSPYHF